MHGRAIRCRLPARSLPSIRLDLLLLRAGSLARGASRAGAPAAGQDTPELAPDLSKGKEALELAARRLHCPGWGAARARGRAALARGGLRLLRKVVRRLGASGKALREALAWLGLGLG